MHISQSYQQQNRHECVDPAIRYNVLGQFLASTTLRNNEKHYYPMNGQKLKMGPLEVCKQSQMSICKKKHKLKNVNILVAINKPISSICLTFWAKQNSVLKWRIYILVYKYYLNFSMIMNSTKNYILKDIKCNLNTLSPHRKRL